MAVFFDRLKLHAPPHRWIIWFCFVTILMVVTMAALLGLHRTSSTNHEGQTAWRFLRGASQHKSAGIDMSSANPQPLHVAVCFFGLTRSLQYTLDSLRRQILDPMAEANIETTLFLHTYNLTSHTNPRSNEKDAPILSHSWKWLRPAAFLMDDASIVEAEFEPHIGLILQHGDPWGEEHHMSLRNLLKQLHSLEKVTRLWQAATVTFDVVMYLRFDVWYFNRLEVGELRNASAPNVLFTPSFHKFGGLNDRLAFGSPTVMARYGLRVGKILDYAKRKPLHSEQFLYNVMKSDVEIKLAFTSLLFARVRATGQLWALPTANFKDLRYSRGLYITIDYLGFVALRNESTH